MNIVSVKDGDLVFKEREVQMIKMLSDDYTVTGIAFELNLDRRCVESWMAKIRKKTGLKTIGGVVGFFYKNGLID